MFKNIIQKKAHMLLHSLRSVRYSNCQMRIKIDEEIIFEADWLNHPLYTFSEDAGKAVNAVIALINFEISMDLSGELKNEIGQIIKNDPSFLDYECGGEDAILIVVD